MENTDKEKIKAVVEAFRAVIWLDDPRMGSLFISHDEYLALADAVEAAAVALEVEE